MVIVHARSWWSGSSAPGTPLRGPLGHVVVHHTAGASVFADQPAEIAELKAIDRYHRGQGWAGLGYSFVVFPSGRVYEGRGWSRVGAHTKGHNSSAIGVCLAGNGEVEPATPLAWGAVHGLIEQGVRQGHVAPSPRVTGHREHAATACPGAKNLGHLELLRGITGVGIEREDDGDMPGQEFFEAWFRHLEAVIKGQTGALHDQANQQHGEAMRTAWATNKLTGANGAQIAAIDDRFGERLDAVNQEMAAMRQLLDELTRPAPDPDTTVTTVMSAVERPQ